MLTKILNQVTVSDGVARLTDGPLASSTVTMNEALRKIVNSKIPLIDAGYMAFTASADLLGLEKKGRTVLAADADLALIDSDFNVHWTMVDERIQP